MSVFLQQRYFLLFFSKKVLQKGFLVSSIQPAQHLVYLLFTAGVLLK